MPALHAVKSPSRWGVRGRASLLGGLIAFTLLSAPALQAAPQPPLLPGQETPKPEAVKKKPSEDLPEGVPTTRENVYLPSREEVRLGRQVANQVPGEYEVITEGPQYERLQRISKAIVAVIQKEDIVEEYVEEYRLPKGNDRAKRVPFEFSFTLVRPKSGQREINAFSLAGGPVFVSIDLMEYVGSDDELAGVLGHEIAHVCYHHVVQMVQKQAKAQREVMWGTLGSLLAGLGGAGSEAFGALYGVQMLSVAKLSGYGRDLEREADRVGANILIHTPYNPAGILSFMKKLARDEARRGDPDFGIYQSHPYSSERVQLLEAHLRERRVPIDESTLRRVANRFRIDAGEARDTGSGAAVRLNGRTVICLSEPGEYPSASQRAEAVAQQLQDLFLHRRLTIRDLRVREDGVTIAAFGKPLLKVLPGDAQAAKKTPPQLAADALKAIQTELWIEKLDDAY